MTPHQRLTLQAATERLLPSTGDSAGAAEARVMSFVDWAVEHQCLGQHFARAAEALALLDDLAATRCRKQFAECDETEQDAILKNLHAFPHVVPRLRFESLLYITLAGYLCHPRCGGNHCLAGWRQIGFLPVPPPAVET